MKIIRIIAGFAFASITSHSGSTFAIEFDYSLYSTLRYSDNLAQSNEQVSGTSLNTGGTFNFANENQNVWAVDFSGAVSQEYFSVDSLDTQDRNQVSASIEYKSPSSNFEFLVRDDYSQAPRDRFALQEVNNLVNVNVLTARPSYFYQFTPLDTINTEITYLQSTREGLDTNVLGQESLDFINISKEIRYEKTINTSQTLSLVFDTIETEFEEENLGVNFKQDNFFMRWIGAGRLNQVQLEVGQTKVTNDEQNFDTELYNVLYSRQINSNHSFGASYRNSVNFVVSESFIDQNVVVDDQIGNFGSAQKIKTFNVNYTFSGDALNGIFQIFSADYEGIDRANSEKRSGASFTGTYSLSQIFEAAPQTNLVLNIQTTTNEFNNLTDESVANDVEVYSARFNYFIRPTFSVYFQLLKRNVSSTSTTTDFVSGDSESASIGISYTPSSRQ
jgi:hypothetical protein